MTRHAGIGFLLAFMLSLLHGTARAQTIAATLEGRVYDSSSAALPGATITAVHATTGITRTAATSADGNYQIGGLAVGEYSVSAELAGFKREVRTVLLQVGQNAAVNFTLQVGALTEQVMVEGRSELAEPTRTSVSSVINEAQIDSLPVNGRQFIDFALLAPGVTVGETTSGSTDVIIEPVTKISFAGQNIHFNLVTVDGADNMSTASGVQKTTPSQEAVQEFRVINTQYSVEAGRAVGGIVNIITKSGTNAPHGSAYEFFRNDKLDARSILASPGLFKLHQNQFGATLGGPLTKDRAFFFANYEGQRRSESPFYNSVVLANIDAINRAKTTLFGSLPPGAPGTLPPENLTQTRTFDYDTFLVKLNRVLARQHSLALRYFFNDARQLNVSPLNDGFDLPSAFKDNFFRDQSLVGSVTSILSASLLNEVRVQFARRSFDFPTATAQPHLEVANTFAMGVNRGNPEFYREPRFEISDSVTWARARHTVELGGNFNFVRTTESFPLFYPFEAQFATLADLLNGNPAIIFYQKNEAPLFSEATIDPGIYQERRIPDTIRNLAKGTLDHTYTGFFVQDKWRATDRLTLNAGVRYEFETWPKEALDSDLDNVDPRAGFAYNVGTRRNLVIRGGAGIFHGTIPSPLLACQRPSCGGVRGRLGGREDVQDDLDAATRLLGFVPFNFLSPSAARTALLSILGGRYPVPFGPGTPGIEADAVVVRFAQNHQAPYGLQASLGFELEPFKNATVSASYLHVTGRDLGSFYNVNQPAATGQIVAHDSSGRTGSKDIFFVGGAPGGPPGAVDPSFLIYFEADSLWKSEYNGLLLNLTQRPARHLGFGVSYTWSKSTDNGPNPSFVLIPQNSARFDLEDARSSDHIAHRVVANATIVGPTDRHPALNDFEIGLIVSLQSPRYFTKYVGFDANGDGFGTNDRVGIEPRNTFKGDAYQSLDVRVSRSFRVNGGARLQALAEVFNLFNTLNVRFYNTVYGAPDFIDAGAPGTFLEGSPNPSYGTPRAIFNPRQVQVAIRLSF